MIKYVIVSFVHFPFWCDFGKKSPIPGNDDKGGVYRTLEKSIIVLFFLRSGEEGFGISVGFALNVIRRYRRPVDVRYEVFISVFIVVIAFFVALFSAVFAMGRWLLF